MRQKVSSIKAQSLNADAACLGAESKNLVAEVRWLSTSAWWLRL